MFLSTRIDRFLVDMEFIKLAVRSEDLKIEPVVVKLRNDVTFSKMGVKVIPQGRTELPSRIFQLMPAFAGITSGLFWICFGKDNI